MESLCKKKVFRQAVFSQERIHCVIMKLEVVFPGFSSEFGSLPKS